MYEHGGRSVSRPHDGAFPGGLPIGDAWEPAAGTAEVVFPYDGSVIGRAPGGDVTAARRAVDEALTVRQTVGRLPFHVRRNALLAVHDAVAARRDDFPQLLMLETGKPLVDCRVEVDHTLLTLHTAGEEAARLHGETLAARPAAERRRSDGFLGTQTDRCGRGYRGV
ncbi:MAG: aldehyde dehydrogenase family protein [Pseudonocardiaceae bacterium]|nr:aldehyde dehydrogenase family protein [Pseudonocardiaceae bacterium]